MLDDKPYTELDLRGLGSQLIFVPTQDSFIMKMVNAMRYFFGRSSGTFSDHFSTHENFPFKGFVFHGPPGSGKTEAVIEAGRRLFTDLGGEEIEVRVFHISPTDINRGRVGEMEQRLRKVFRDAQNADSRTRTVLLFDDIDTLIMGRDDKRSREFTVALNATFFHEVDRLNTTNTMICATTNKTEMLDDAVKSRLWLEEAPAPNLEEMKAVAKSALPIAIINGKTQDDLLALAGERIEHHINEGRPPSFRLARMAGIEVLIREVIGWE